MNLSYEVKDRRLHPRKCETPKPPYHVAIILAKTGTLNGSQSIVMADEMMAHAVAQGLKSSSPLIASCHVVQFGARPSGVNAWVFMHHFQIESVSALIGQDPAWLWVHNAGVWTPIELMRINHALYTSVFHAGQTMAPRLGLKLFTHGLEDEKLFRVHPGQKHDEAGIVFVGNATMHLDLVPDLIRLGHATKCTVYGHGWSELGVPNLGRIPMSETPRILTAATVCIDHVSKHHRAEGMTSTRAHQALACGAAVVSTQDPSLFPEEMRRHIVFASQDRLVDEALRLSRDTAARCALRHKAPLSVHKYTIRKHCKSLWNMMQEDLAEKALRFT